MACRTSPLTLAIHVTRPGERTSGSPVRGEKFSRRERPVEPRAPGRGASGRPRRSVPLVSGPPLNRRSTPGYREPVKEATGRRRNVLLLTGVPGIGKTTVIRDLAASLSGWRVAGFYTEEIRVAGQRHGFRAVTFDGRERVMAHVDYRGPHRVGKYGVDVAAIDALAESALPVRQAVDVYLVDESSRGKGRLGNGLPRFA